jgi:hypothetical protein
MLEKTVAKNGCQNACERSPMPRANKPQPQTRSAAQAQHLDERLDAALIETFPASDPIAVGRPTATEPSLRAGDRPAQGAKVRAASPQTASPKTASPKTSSETASKASGQASGSDAGDEQGRPAQDPA